MDIPSIPPKAISKSLNRSQLSAGEQKAFQAEKDAYRRVNQAEQDVESARRAADSQIELVRDRYQKLTEEENEKQLEMLESQRLKGYQQLRDMQRAQQAEIAKVRREGEKELARLDDYFKNTVGYTQAKGERELDEVTRNQAIKLHYEQQFRNHEADEMTRQLADRNDDLKTKQDVQLAKLEESHIQQVEKARNRTIEANEAANETFKQQFEHTLSEHQEVLGRLNRRAVEDLQKLKEEYQTKLGAYSQRGKDPFYRMMDAGMRLRENDDAYVLTAKIPEHERKGVSVALRGNEIVLSGYRRNEERVKKDEGGQQETHSFQSFSESFKLDHPVEANRIARTFDGDELIVLIPKSGARPYVSPTVANVPPPSAMKPRFPDNLPIAQADAKRGSSQEPIVEVKSPPGSGRLLT